MNRPTFMEGVLLALVVSFLASFLYASLTWFFSEIGVIQLIISIVGFAYIVYMLIRSEEKTGRVVVMVTWFLVVSFIWILDIPLALFCLVHLAMLWLIRSLYFYSSVISSMLDFTLVALSLLFSTWAFYQTESVFMSLWSFFLMQSLFVLIPSRLGQSKQNCARQRNSDREFNRAFNNASDAVRKLTALK